jgi:uncharacterized protein (DUF111 family)
LGAALADLLAANVEAVYARLALVHYGVGDPDGEVPEVLRFLVVEGRRGLIQGAVLLLLEVGASPRTERLIVGLHGPCEVVP